VMPGLPPRVLQAKREGQDATLMLQFLGGRTLQEIVLGEEAGLLDTAVAHVQDTFRAVWRTTIRPVAVNADFLGQLKGRLGDVYRVHPEFQGPDKQVGSLHVPSFARLLAASAEISAALPAPFSVLVHGDLNIDNILFDSEEGKLHLVDLHRSTESDYVQDVSVFLASNFRLPLFDEPHRKRMDEVALGFCAFVRDFAREQNDATFEARLALALARSFTTSTRFELNPPFARAMHVRSVCLLEQLIAHRPRPWSAYRFPTDILVF